MSTAKERLRRFLALADQGAVQRAALAEELVDFLVSWPPECPLSMRGPVLALLDMTLQEANGILRKKLAARLASLEDLPLGLANEIFHCAPPAMRARLLARNADAASHEPLPAYDPLMLLVAARKGPAGADLPHRLVGSMHVPLSTAAAILDDDSGMSLAVVCKGTRLGRAFYSALTLLAFQGQPGSADRLAVYDAIPQPAASNLTASWQLQNRHSAGARAAQ